VLEKSANAGIELRAIIVGFIVYFLYINKKGKTLSPIGSCVFPRVVY
jgi:hypothetical protein